MKRADQRAATRQALAEAALALFVERGVDATTVEDIAAAAGVSPRTFFLHFPAKVAAVFPDHESNLARFRQALAAMPSGGDDVAAMLSGGDDVTAVCRLLVDSIGWQVPSAFRRARYGLVETSDAVRELDARTDRDYEDAITEHLVARWGTSPQSRLAAGAVAGVVLGIARAALLAWGRDGMDPVTSAARMYARLAGSPLGAVATEFVPGCPDGQ